MKEHWDYEVCVQVLAGEIDIIKRISAAQTRVRQAVINREWTDFDQLIGEVNRIGAEFAVLEEERIGLFSGLEAGISETPAEKPFYTLLSNLPLDESREIARLYRELKTETYRMRALNESFLAYLNEAKTMAAAYLEAVCPARGGKLYTRKGGRVSQDLRSMVINNNF